MVIEITFTCFVFFYGQMHFKVSTFPGYFRGAVFFPIKIIANGNIPRGLHIFHRALVIYFFIIGAERDFISSLCDFFRAGQQLNIRVVAVINDIAPPKNIYRIYACNMTGGISGDIDHFLLFTGCY